MTDALKAGATALNDIINDIRGRPTKSTSPAGRDMGSPRAPSPNHLEEEHPLLEQVKVLLAEAESEVESPARCRDKATHIDAIVTPSFVGQPEFEILRAKAWTLTAYSYAYSSKDIGACRSAVQNVDRIANPGFCRTAESSN